jgi:O-methyltransferase domain/Dimerisation domain
VKDDKEVPPEGQLMQALFGFMVSKGLSVAASLGVADALKDGPMYYIDLAAAVGADQKALHRVMRLLSGLGIFEETKAGEYKLTPVSDLLRSDHPHSMRAMAVMITDESHWLPWGRLADVVRSGRSGAQHAFGTDIFTWFQREENQDQWETFNSAMTGFSAGTAVLVADVYDFSRFRKIVDIGGGHGFLLRKVLERAPTAKGVLFDLPGVVASADKGSLGERIQAVGGSFFEGVPEGGDCYTLKHIIHDWSDDQCQKILKNIAAVMAPEGRVLVLETVMPESPTPHPAKFMDVNMLAMTEGGCERSEHEYAELLQASGLKLSRVIPTAGAVAVVEGEKA